MQQDEQESRQDEGLVKGKTVSRREFLKYAGLTGAAVAVSGGLGGILAACGDDEPAATTAGPTTTAAGPTTTAASAISSTNFTAHWNALGGAASYQLDVSSNATFGASGGGTAGATGAGGGTWAPASAGAASAVVSPASPTVLRNCRRSVCVRSLMVPSRMGCCGACRCRGRPAPAASNGP